MNNPFGWCWSSITLALFFFSSLINQEDGSNGPWMYHLWTKNQFINKLLIITNADWMDYCKTSLLHSETRTFQIYLLLYHLLKPLSYDCMYVCIYSISVFYKPFLILLLWFVFHFHFWLDFSYCSITLCLFG